MVQSHRTLGVTCLTECAIAYAAAAAAAGSAKAPAHARMLHTIVEPIVAAAAKGSFTGSPEQLAALQHICVGCMPHAPEVAVKTLLVGLLEAESLDVVLAGLRATFEVLLRSTARLSHVPAGTSEVRAALRGAHARTTCVHHGGHACHVWCM